MKMSLIFAFRFQPLRGASYCFVVATEEEKLPFKCSCGKERGKSLSPKSPPPKPIEKLIFEKRPKEFSWLAHATYGKLQMFSGGKISKL